LSDAQDPHQAAQLGRRRLEEALEASKVGTWQLDLRSNQVVWDRRMYAITGSDRPLTVDEWDRELAHPDDRLGARPIPPEGRFSTPPLRIQRSDGTIRWVISSGSVISEDGEPRWMVGATVDITEQQQLQEQLAKAQQLESLGHLTAGVAHNFNNMLQIIQPCLEALRQAGVATRDLEDAVAASNKAAQVVAELIAYSGQHRRDTVVTSAAQVCRDTARLCQRSFPPSVQLELDIRTTCSILAEPGSLEQVLGNLLLNARDALVEAETPDARVSLQAECVDRFDEHWVEIVCVDNGPGIAENVRDRLFEPFVTTKRDRGTGLGLASCQSIVQRHGGQLAYRIPDEGGTEFLLLWPTTDREPAPAIHAAPSDTLASDKPPILCIDDDEVIRRLVARGLEYHGFETEAVGGAAALDALLDRRADFGFVLLDRSLRGAAGGTLLPVLRRRLPNALVYFFTGEIGIDLAEADGVVSKPLTMSKLAEAIDTALRQAAAE